MRLRNHDPASVGEAAANLAEANRRQERHVLINAGATPVPACDELSSTPIYAKELHELLIKAKLNK